MSRRIWSQAGNRIHSWVGATSPNRSSAQGDSRARAFRYRCGGGDREDLCRGSRFSRHRRRSRRRSPCRRLDRAPREGHRYLGGDFGEELQLDDELAYVLISVARRCFLVRRTSSVSRTIAGDRCKLKAPSAAKRRSSWEAPPDIAVRNALTRMVLSRTTSACLRRLRRDFTTWSAIHSSSWRSEFCMRGLAFFTARRPVRCLSRLPGAGGHARRRRRASSGALRAAGRAGRRR
jgi:hypothetical protein